MLNEIVTSTKWLYQSLKKGFAKTVIAKFLFLLRPMSPISLLKGVIRLCAVTPLIIFTCALGVIMFMILVTEYLCEYILNLLDGNKS